MRADTINLELQGGMLGRARGSLHVAWIVVVVIFSVLLLLVVPAAQQAREAARRTQCK